MALVEQAFRLGWHPNSRPAGVSIWKNAVTEPAPKFLPYLLFNIMIVSNPFSEIAQQRITSLVRDEVREIGYMQADSPHLSQELVVTRAQLAALRWAATVNRDCLEARLAELPKLIRQAEQLMQLLQERRHPADGPAQDAAHALVLCLHGEELALHYVDVTERTSRVEPEAS